MDFDVRDVAKSVSTLLEHMMVRYDRRQFPKPLASVELAALQVLESARRAYLQAITDGFLSALA